MATATQIDQAPFLSLADLEDADVADAARLAALCRPALNMLATQFPEMTASSIASYTDDRVLAAPLDAQHRIPDELHDLPSRRGRDMATAASVGRLLYPTHEGSLAALIRYEKDRVRLRAWAALQRRHDALKKMRSRTWVSRIAAQGAWEPTRKPISRRGVPALPMPVKVASGDELAPLLRHLRAGGGFEAGPRGGGKELEDGRGEQRYGVRGAEFPRGVVYEDGRMDLCKMVVGPDHIGALMESLRGNGFVRHFLLGNNIVGPRGAREMAAFVDDFPGRMQTWYLAGNCIDAGGFGMLVDAWTREGKDSSLTDVWMKRNPLGQEAAVDAARLVLGTGVQTLDLDQTELGDEGVAKLFDHLLTGQRHQHGDDAVDPAEGHDDDRLALRRVYLAGDGISEAGARSIGRFLASERCGIEALYLTCNPLGDAGAAALAEGLSSGSRGRHLKRLMLESVGMGTAGAVAILGALPRGMRSLGLGQSYATEDLGQAYNWIEDGAVDALGALIREGSELEYLSLGLCAISPAGMIRLTESILSSSSLLYFRAECLPERMVKLANGKNSKKDTDTDNENNNNNKTNNENNNDDGDNDDNDERMPGADAQKHGASCSVEARWRLQELARCEVLIREHLEKNVRARYGDGSAASALDGPDGEEMTTPTMSYQEFIDREKRWLVSDEGVRRIDSVYRTRDVGLARRKGGKPLAKHWEEGDDSLERVMRMEALTE